MRRASAPVLLGLILATGCNPAPPEPLPCDGHLAQVTQRLGVHFPQGTPLEWESNPPATGPHYSDWAPWARAYDAPVPRGNYVHNLEHGGVVLLYRTPGDAVGATLRALGQSLAQDPLCQTPINARWLATPDALLPEGVQVAAASWGHTYTASCLDDQTLRDFVSAHYGQGSEATCADGFMAW